ncbi:MAG TPA: hypothetical protein PK598_12435, partial [Thermoanaerobaculia bacterium]|nr:hypothetical protein [Thermoanaerobaculia bacterium]
MALSVENFVKEIESMSVLELNTLVKALEEKFGVSAAMMAAPAAAAAAAPAAAAEEQTEFTVVLTDAGDKTMHEGIRTKPHSLNECIACHASQKTGSVIGDGGFCQSCHAYAAVK